MFDSLVSLSSLQHLDVNSSTIAYDIISSTIQNNINLSHINVSNYCWKQSSSNTQKSSTILFCDVVKCLSSLQQLQYISIGGNNVTNRTADVIAAVIYSNKKLQHFDLSNCQTPQTGLFAILKALSREKHLSYLDISSNYLSKESAKEVTRMIKSNKAIAHLNLSNFTDEEGHICNDLKLSASMAKALAKLSNLQFLNISHNKIPKKAAIKLASVITSNTSLTHLNVSNCSIDDDGILIILDALTQLNSLVFLNINDNPITMKATRLVYAVLSSNKWLDGTCFTKCFAEGAVLSKLTHISEEVTTTHLDLEGNIINNKVADFICRSLTTNDIQYLNISNCDVSDSLKEVDFTTL